jgi:DNA-binding NtrC family response regulator
MVRLVKSAVIASENPDLIDQLSNIMVEYDYSFIIVKSAIESILKILEQEVDLLILDSDFAENTIMNSINIIKKMRPRLPIVVLPEDFAIDTVRKLTKAGVFYCAMKPVQIDEIEQVLEAVNRFHLKYGNIGTSV